MRQRSPAAALAAVLALLGAAAELAAQEKSEHPAYIVADKPAGVQLYVPGEWGVLGLGVVNPTDESAEVLAAMHFAGDPTLQYGRQFWIPPRARRYTWYPLLTPETLPADEKRAEIRALLIDRSGGREQFIGSRSGQMLQMGLLMLEHERPLTGIFADPGDTHARHALVAGRLSRDLSWRVAGLRSDTMPPSAETLGALDHLVVCSDQVTADAAGLLALRRWLYDGGRLWIMLDEVRPETAALLLGDAFRCQTVDRVDLTEFEMQMRRANGTWEKQPRRQFDEPVEMLRVLPTGMHVTHTINEWPAAFWQQAGQGRVLYTTLAPRGWTRPRTPQDRREKQALKNAPVIATAPLNLLMTEFLQPRPAPALPAVALQDYVTDKIGYEIVSRGPVVATLSGFCLSVLGLGVWLRRRGQLEQLGWLGPALAVVVAVGLALLGLFSRRAVPPTVAVAQFVEMVPNSDDLQMHGTLAIYNQSQSDQPLGARRGGVFMPDMTGQGGTTRRMVWTDLDAWHWENLTLPAGVRTASFSYGAKLDQPLRARATFDANGLLGTLDAAPFTELADCIIATPARRTLRVRLGEEGAWRAGMDDQLPPGQYLGGTVVSGEQRQRQAVYEKLLTRANQDAYPARPSLLFWAAPLDMQLVVDPAARQSGSALVAVPLELERPAAGTAIAIPAALLPFESVQGPGRAGMSAAYKNREGEWIGPLTESSDVFLRFQLPPEILPVELTEATFTIKLTAPGRKFELLSAATGELIPLAEQDSPLGTLSFTIDDPRALLLDADGGLILAFRVGDRQDASGGISSAGWQVNYVQLEAQATVSPSQK